MYRLLLYRATLSLLLCCCVSCSRVPESQGPISNAKNTSANAELEDGGVVANPNRDKAESFFVALRKVKTANEEKKLLTDFGEWLRKHDYKIRVEEKKGAYDLSCPYFPPVTPWVSHTFLDIRHLELLPQMDEAG